MLNEDGMKIEEFQAAVLLADFMRSHLLSAEKASEAVIEALHFIPAISHDEGIKREIKEEPTITKAVAELAKVPLTTSYQTIVKRTVPKGKILYVSKVEMYCDNYDTTQWNFYVNSELVELENNTRWEDIYLPVALTMTFDGNLEILGNKYIEVKAKDSAGGDAWGDITGVIR